MQLVGIRGQQFPSGLMMLHQEESHRQNHRQMNLMNLNILLVQERIQLLVL
jgi:hypothetical protein